MNGTEDRAAPGFIHGAEVARVNPAQQPGFELQLPLLQQEPQVKRKLTTALLIIFGVFFAGMAVGAVLGIFI